MPFILITAFAVLNLFIAVIVNAMQSEHEAEHRAAVAAGAGHGDSARLEEELRAPGRDIRELRQALTADRGEGGRGLAIPAATRPLRIASTSPIAACPLHEPQAKRCRLGPPAQPGR